MEDAASWGARATRVEATNREVERTEAADRTGQDEVWKKVMKNYPTTTHSHTIEYRVDSQDDLNKIFASAEQAFRTATPSSYIIQGSGVTVAPSQ